MIFTILTDLSEFQADLFGMDEAQAEELERCKQMLDNYKNALEKIRMYYFWF